MPQYEVVVPLRYINGQPYYKGQVIELTSGQYAALDEGGQAALRDIDGGGGGGGGGGGVAVWDAAAEYGAGEVAAHNNEVWITPAGAVAGKEPGAAPVTTLAKSDGPLNTYGVGVASARYSQPLTPAAEMVISRVRIRAVLTNPDLLNMQIDIGTTKWGTEVASSSRTFNKVDQDESGWVTWSLVDPVTLQAGTQYFLNVSTGNIQITFSTAPTITGMTLGTLSLGTAANPNYGTVTAPGAAPFELVKVETSPWVTMVEGGWNVRGEYNPDLPYNRYDLVTYKQGAYYASDDVLAGTTPSPRNADHYVVPAENTGAGSYGSLGQQLAQKFTVTKSITFQVLRMHMHGTLTAQSVTGGIATGVGASFAWMAGASKTQVVTGVLGDIVDFVFDAPVTLNPGTDYWVASSMFTYMNVAPAPTGPITLVGPISYGSTYQTNWAGVVLPFFFRTLPVPNPWKAIATGLDHNQENNTWFPPDPTATWMVGSETKHYLNAANLRRMFYDPATGVFRAGSANAEHWSGSNLGANSAAFGSNAKAIGAASFACGTGTTASGTESHAEGSNCTASGAQSHAEGLGTTASAQGTHAEGGSTSVTGSYGHAEGFMTLSEGMHAHASGSRSVARRRGEKAHADGLIANPGDAQQGQIHMPGLTTTATPLVLRGGDSSSPGNSPIVISGWTTNVLTIPANRAFQLKVRAVARRSDVAGEVAAFVWEGVVTREVAASSIRLVGVPIETAWGDTPATDTWAMAVGFNNVDATNKYITVTVTGEAGKTIRWSVSMDWVEVG